MRFIVILLASVLLFSCAGEADRFPSMQIVHTYSTLGNPVDFDISGNDLCVAEDIVGFGLYNLSTGALQYRIHEAEGIALQGVRLVRFYAPFNVLIAYDTSISTHHPFYTYRYNDTSGNYVYTSPPSSGYNYNVRDMLFETIAGNPNQFRTYYGCYRSGGNIVQMGLYTISNQPAHNSQLQADVPNSIHGITFHKNDFLLCAMGERGVAIVDKSTMNSISVYNTPGSARDTKSSGEIVYVADRSAGLGLIDISDRVNPTQIGWGYSVEGNAISLDIWGDFLAVGTTSGGLYLFGISDPVNPVLYHRIQSGDIGEINKVMFHDGHLFVASRSLGVVRISIKK